MRSPRWLVVAGTAALFICFTTLFSRAQEPTPPVPQAPATPQAQGPDKPQNPKYSHAKDFLIIGTIFDPKGYAFPAAELRIRRSNEKKYRWDSYTNSRGEFVLFVKQETAYEMVIRAKGFAD